MQQGCNAGRAAPFDPVQSASTDTTAIQQFPPACCLLHVMRAVQHVQMCSREQFLELAKAFASCDLLSPAAGYYQAYRGRALHARSGCRGDGLHLRHPGLRCHLLQGELLCIGGVVRHARLMAGGCWRVVLLTAACAWAGLGLIVCWGVDKQAQGTSDAGKWVLIS